MAIRRAGLLTVASDYKTQIPIGSVAVALARVGFRVFPALPGEKRPAVGNGVKAASVDLDRVRKWWSKGQWNVGVATGEGLVVIFDGQRIRYSNVFDIENKAAIAVEHVIIHTLVKDHGYDVKNRKYLKPGELMDKN